MFAEIIAIGDELTSGQRLDTNSRWLSEQLGAIGVRTLFHTTVADDIEANVQAFRIASQRANFVISTGGLGPTADDLTRQAMAESFNRPLKLDEASLAYIRQLFTSRGRQMPPQNQIQAMFPVGSSVIVNPNGTAPGIDLQVSRAGADPCRIFALPGVPAEMKQMWDHTLRGAILEDLGDQVQVVQHYRIKCFGKGESDLESMLPDLIRRGRDPIVGITVSKATITLRVTAAGPSQDVCWQRIQPTVATIRDCLGDLIFGEEDEELQHAVARSLLGVGQTFAVCEAGTGGLISHWMNEVANAEACFLGGITVPSVEAADRLLGVSSTLDLEEQTEAMALQIRERCQSDFGLAVSPFPADPQDPNAKVLLGLATAQGVTVAQRRFAGHPDILKARAAKQALDLLRLHLLREAS